MSDFNSSGGDRDGRGSGSRSHHAPVHCKTQNPGGSDPVGAGAGQGAQSSSLSQDGQHKSAPHRLKEDTPVDLCTVRLLYVTIDSNKISESPVNLNLSVPEWMHIKSSPSYQKLEDNLKGNGIILLRKQVKVESIDLQLKVHCDQTVEQKSTKAKYIQKIFEEITNEFQKMFYYVPSDMREKAKAMLQESQACHSKSGSVYSSQENGIFVFVAEKDHGNAAFDEFQKILSSLAQKRDQGFGSDGSNGRHEIPSVDDRKETDLPATLLGEATKTIVETFDKSEVEKYLELSPSLNQFLKASESARNFVVRKLSKVHIKCKFAHENSLIIFSADSPDVLKSSAFLNMLVREITLQLKDSKALSLYSLEEICQMLEEMYPCESGELMVFPVSKPEKLILVGIDDAMTVAEEFMQQIETDFSESDIAMPDQKQVSRELLTELESIAKSVEGPLKIRRIRQPPYGVKVTGKSSSIEEFRKKMFDFLPSPSVNVPIEEAALDLLRAKPDAEVFLKQDAENHGVKVSVDLERKVFTIQGTSTSGLNADKFAKDWYRVKTAPLSHALKEIMEDDIRSYFHDSESVDDGKVLITLKDKMLTVIATADEYPRAEKLLEDIRLRKISCYDSGSSKPTDDSSANIESNKTRGDGNTSGLKSTRHTPQDVATGQEGAVEISDVDFVRIRFEEHFLDQRNPKLEVKVDSRTLNITSHEAKFLFERKDFMNKIKEMVRKRFQATITDVQSGKGFKITIKRESETTPDTEWKNQVCDIFTKAEGHIAQKKFMIKEMSFKTIEERISRKEYDNLRATFIVLPEESAIVALSFKKVSEKTMSTLYDSWKTHLVEENIDKKQKVESFMSEKTDVRKPPDGAGHESLEDIRTVKLALVMNEDEYDICASQYQTWKEMASHLETCKAFDLLAGKKMIGLQGQKKSVDVVVERLLTILKEKKRAKHEHDEATEYWKPLIVTDIVPIEKSLRVSEGSRHLVLTSWSVQNEILNSLLTNQIVCSIDSDGKHLMIWHDFDNNPETALQIVTKALKHRIISLKRYGDTPFSTIRNFLEQENSDFVQVSQSHDDVWICFLATMEEDIDTRLSQLDDEYLMTCESLPLKKDVYAYYKRFRLEDLKALRMDHRVEIDLKMSDKDRYELTVKGTKQRVKQVVDILESQFKLEWKDMPMEDVYLTILKTKEGAKCLESIQSNNKCILSVVDSTEATFEASFQEGPNEVYRYSPKPSVGKRTVTVVTGKPEDWPTDVVMVPVWNVPQLAEKMSPLKKLVGSNNELEISESVEFPILDRSHGVGAVRITADTFDRVGDAFKSILQYIFEINELHRKEMLFLKCPVCVKHFNQTDRRPHLLHSCLHAFCTQCLHQLLIKEGKGQITCPLCRQVQKVEGKVDTLPLDPVRDKLVTYSKIKENQQVLCGECEEKDAISRCQDCKSNLCTECDFVHKRHRMSKDHSIMSLDEAQKLPVETLSKGYFCLSHPKYQFEFYCATEDQLCCVACAAYDHKGHDLQKLEWAATTKQQETEITLEEAHFIADRLKEAKIEDARQEKIILEVQNKSLSDINMLFDNLVKVLDDRKSQLKAAVNEKSSNFLSAVEKTKAANDQTLAIIESTDTYFTQAKEKADVVEMLQMYPTIKRSVQDLQQPQAIPRFAECVTDFRFQKHKSDEVMTFVTDLGAFGTLTKGMTIQSIWNKKDLDNYIIVRLHDQSFTDTDIMSLKEKQHITDTVLDALLEDMKKLHGNVHHVNTQSWSSIFDGQYGQPNTWMNHDKVKFMDFKKVYGVINPSQKHWKFVGIDIENCRVIYLDPSGSTPKDRKQAQENWSIYMKRRCKLGFEDRQVTWTCDETRQDKQMGSSNCGIMCWMYAQRFLEGGTYTDLPDCEFSRLKVATSFLEKCEKLDRRSCIACGSDEDNGMVECEGCGRKSHRKCMPERERYQAFVCKTCQF